MIAGFEGDSRSVEEGVDEGEVVRAHLREALRVFVDERCLDDWVDGARGRFFIHSLFGDRGSASVIGPFSGASVIANGEEEDFDSVREADIEARG